MTPKEIGERIKIARESKELNQKELAEKIQVHPATIKRYEDGFIQKIKMPIIQSIAIALSVNPMWLLGKSEFMQTSDMIENWNQSDIPDFPNIFPIETKKVPLLGKIAAGQPVMAEECFDSYVQCGNFIKADFCLRVQGDSMINARIYDGDIVFIHQQPEVENGEIAAVAIDDAVTLKRVYFADDSVMLRAENPKYKPMIFTKNDCLSFRILGKAVAFQGDIV